MKLSTREKKFIIVTIIIILLILYYNLFYRDFHQETSAIANDIQRIKSDLEHYLHAKNQIKDLEDQISKLTGNAEKKFLIQDDNLIESEFLIFLENCIKDQGVGTRLRFEDYKEYGDFSLLTITLNFETSYSGIARILSGIENSHLPIIIEQVKAQKKQADLDNSSYNWDIEAVLYLMIFQKENIS